MISYGKVKTNADFLYSYGFVIENNPNGLSKPTLDSAFKNKEDDPLRDDKKKLTGNLTSR